MLSHPQTIALTSKSNYPQCTTTPFPPKKMPHQCQSTTLLLKSDYHRQQTIALTSKSNYHQLLPISLPPKKVPLRPPSTTLFLKSDYHRPKTIALTSKRNYPRCLPRFSPIKKYPTDGRGDPSPRKKCLSNAHQRLYSIKSNYHRLQK